MLIFLYSNNLISFAYFLRMDAIFNLLQQYRLESYYNQFLQMGVKEEQDFVDGVTDEDLYSLGECSEYGINMNHLQSKVKVLHVSRL